MAAKSHRLGCLVAILFLLIGVVAGALIPREYVEKARSRETLDSLKKGTRKAGERAAEWSEEAARKARKEAAELGEKAAEASEQAVETVREKVAEKRKSSAKAKPASAAQAESSSAPPAPASVAAHGATSSETCVTEIHCKHFLFGMPRGTPPTNDLIIRDIYALSSNDATKLADWVAYRLTPGTVTGDAKTSREWAADPWLDDDETIEPSDYKGANQALKVDRGHQAPLASFRGTPDWADTNFLSNITPQRSDLNQGPWRVLEDKERDLVLATKGPVFSLTGPLFERETATLPGADEPHRIPSGYWKIIAVPPDSSDPLSMKIAAFIMDQDTPRNAAPADFLVTVDEVERRGGLDFFSELPDDAEATLEAAVDDEWAKGRF